MKFPGYTITENHQQAESPAMRFALELQPDLDFFDGHFEQVPILPAVAQLHIVHRLAQQYLQISQGFCGFRQLKFMSPIQPQAKAFLSIQFNRVKEQLSFCYEVDGKVKSKGVLLYQLGQAS